LSGFHISASYEPTAMFKTDYKGGGWGGGGGGGVGGEGEGGEW